MQSGSGLGRLLIAMYGEEVMSADRPFPVLDLSAHSFVVCLAAAGRSHVGNYAPDQRPRPTLSAERSRWAASSDRVCLYCGEVEPTGGEEHVLSVALGNWFWVIPPHVVCSRCNSGVLSTLDSRLRAHPLIALVRTLVGITGRTGQPAEVGASNIRLRRNADGVLHIEADHARHMRRSDETVTMTPKWANFGPPQRRVTARALLKVALGTIWLAKGPDETRTARYDHVRDAVLGVNEVPLQYGFGNSQLPGHALQIMTVSQDSTPGLRVVLDYFGIQLWAETNGYRDEASPDFLSSEIDVEFDHLNRE
jgi:hypothetical protein